MSEKRHFDRIGGVAAIGGALLLLVFTALHPAQADPNDPRAAFTEYAADSWWIATHIGQFLGIAAIGVGLAALSHTLQDGRAHVWGRLGLGGAIISVALAAGLQAVDGVALKAVVDQWAASTSPERELLFASALTVRQIEIGLASLMSLSFGITVTFYAVALLHSTYPSWLGWLAGVGGAGTVVAGLLQAYTGFSGVAMAISMPASLLVLVWVAGVAIVMQSRS